jgi:hypothetical protein
MEAETRLAQHLLPGALIGTFCLQEIAMEFHLAQVNTARMNADLDDPVMSGFVQRLDEINALADGSKGFVWRFQTEEQLCSESSGFGSGFW